MWKLSAALWRGLSIRKETTWRIEPQWGLFSWCESKAENHGNGYVSHHVSEHGDFPSYIRKWKGINKKWETVISNYPCNPTSFFWCCHYLMQYELKASFYLKFSICTWSTERNAQVPWSGPSQRHRGRPGTCSCRTWRGRRPWSQFHSWGRGAETHTYTAVAQATSLQNVFKNMTFVFCLLLNGIAFPCWRGPQPNRKAFSP